MPNCLQYQSLTPKEQIEFMAKVIHLIQSDEVCFSRAQGMIIKGNEQGLFDNVKFNEHVPKEEVQTYNILS